MADIIHKFNFEQGSELLETNFLAKYLHLGNIAHGNGQNIPGNQTIWRHFGRRIVIIHRF